LKLEVSPAGGGSIKINGAIPNSYPATGVFYGRGIANLEAVPAPGYSFAEWSGELSGSDNPVSITLSHDAVITAYFTPVQHTISIQVEGNGATEPAIGSYQYNEGDSVSITAIPDDGWQFAGWIGDVDGAESAQTQVSVTSDKTVTAHFSPVTHTISIQVEGNGATEPAVGSYQYNEGDSVSITAIPDDGWQFAGWSGDLATESAQTQVTVTSDKVVTAHFTPVQHTISIQIEGNGTTEPMVGSYQYNEGDSVIITAIPDDGWQFAGWSGDLDGTESAQTQVAVTLDKTVTAHFSRVIPEWWQALRTFCGGIMTMFVPPPRILEPATAQ
jgi:uncharacterized repeat protein (TIGR02543 family)